EAIAARSDCPAEEPAGDVAGGVRSGLGRKPIGKVRCAAEGAASRRAGCNSGGKAVRAGCAAGAAVAAWLANTAPPASAGAPADCCTATLDLGGWLPV